MNETNSPNSNHNHTAQPKVWSLFWEDLPDYKTVIVSDAWSSDRAIVMEGERKQVTLLLFKESLRGHVNVTVERGAVPSDNTLIAMGRTILAHLAAVPEWRDAP